MYIFIRLIKVDMDELTESRGVIVSGRFCISKGFKKRIRSKYLLLD